jgi:hypothetical protein
MMKRLAVFGLSLLPCSITSIVPQPTGESGIAVVQMSYYAQPGKETEVLENRLQACRVLEKNGVSRGRVMTRIISPRETGNADNPDVVWEGEFMDSASLKRYEDIADKNADFLAARQKMGVLTRKTERRYFQVR